MLDGLAAPDTDQEEHGGQLNFPEEEKEQQVERQEHTHHTCFQDQHQCHVFLDAHFFPATNNGQHGQQGIQDHHWQAQPINTEGITDIELGATSREMDPLEVDRVFQVVEATKVVACTGDTEEDDHRKHE